MARMAPIPFKRGRPSEADELRMELDTRMREEQRMDAALSPLVRRLGLIAQHYGPAAMRTVAALDHEVTRHRRRWALEEAA